MSGIAKSGNVVNPGDEVSTAGTVIAVSGSGQTALVTVLLYTNESIIVQANDCYAVQGTGAALTINGKPFGVGSFATVMGTVLSISGTGTTAKLTISSKSSATQVTHTATASIVPKKN